MGHRSYFVNLDIEYSLVSGPKHELSPDFLEVYILNRCLDNCAVTTFAKVFRPHHDVLFRTAGSPSIWQERAVFNMKAR